MNAPCPFAGCRCTHDGGCDAGWLQRDGAVAPCPVCQPELDDHLFRERRAGRSFQQAMASWRAAQRRSGQREGKPERPARPQTEPVSLAQSMHETDALFPVSPELAAHPLRRTGRRHLRVVR